MPYSAHEDRNFNFEDYLFVMFSKHLKTKQKKNCLTLFNIAIGR